MPADNKMKRYNHFWKWIISQKKMLKVDVDKDKCLQKLLRAEHAREFPSLYGQTKTYCVAESIKEFYRKVLKFHITLREDEDFEYLDDMFDNLALFEGEIDKDKEEAFKKYYFARYTNFSKNVKGDHRAFQTNYLDQIFKNFKRVQRNNTIKQERERKRLRKEEEKAKKQAAKEEMKKCKAKDKVKKQKERQDLLILQKREEKEKGKTVKQMEKNIEDGHLVDLPEEGKKLLEEEREERRRAMEDLREKVDK